VLTPEEAGKITDALEIVNALMTGRKNVDVNAPFADLMDPARPPGGFHVKRPGR